jgi:hypothetical protein
VSQQKGPDTAAQPHRKFSHMITIQVNRTAAQLPSVTTKAVTDFDDAIRNARFALHNGPLDCAINHLEKASRIAGEVGNPHARELANFGSEVRSAFETVQVVEMFFLDLFPEQ